MNFLKKKHRHNKTNLKWVRKAKMALLVSAVVALSIRCGELDDLKDFGDSECFQFWVDALATHKADHNKRISSLYNGVGYPCEEIKAQHQKKLKEYDLLLVVLDSNDQACEGKKLSKNEVAGFKFQILTVKTQINEALNNLNCDL